MKLNEHKTGILDHFKTLHLWLDLGILLILFLATNFIPENLNLLGHLNLKLFLKIIVIIAGLEILSFFSFHLLNQKLGHIFQGFLGGFISSTSVFIKLTDIKNKFHVSNHLLLGLLASVISMLVECLIILYSFSAVEFNKLYLPILVQLILLLFVLLYKNLKESPKKENIDLELDFDHPIIWKNVIKVTFFVFILIFIVRFLNIYLNQSTPLAIFTLSLFEAHSVLAAVLADIQSSTIADKYFFIMIILTGNYVSKSFLVFRSKNIILIKDVILYLTIGILASWTVYFLN